MKIEEARQIYSGQMKSYGEQQAALLKQKQELEQKMRITPEGKNLFANEAAVLELSIQAVDEKQQEYRDYMAKLSEQWAATANMVSARQQGDAMEEYDTLWEEEEESKECENPTEVADNTEVFAQGPDVVDVAETLESVELPE